MPPSDAIHLPPSRTAALAAVEQCLPSRNRPGADIQATLDAQLSRLEDPRDKSLATELAYGYLRLKGRMDHLLRQQMHKPERTHPSLHLVLGIACHELLHLDSVPPHATLSWAVDAVKAKLGGTPARFANAMLRKVQALGQDALHPEFYQATSRSTAEFLSAWHSCPRWLVDLWTANYGPETALAFLTAQTRMPLFGFRVNALRPGAQALHETLLRASAQAPPYSRFPYVGYAALPPVPPVSMDQSERQGVLSRQSPAVGALLHSLGWEDWPDRIWDACCGRGGKTTALLEQGKTLWASDVNTRRLRGLRADCSRLDLPFPPTVRADAARPPLKRPPELILLDAPCSGLGVLSRRPDAKWKRSPGDIPLLAALQTRMLTGCAELLRPGGLLAYATCTLTREENELQGQRIEALGFTPQALAKPESFGALREFFWGGLWKKT